MDEEMGMLARGLALALPAECLEGLALGCDPVLRAAAAMEIEAPEDYALRDLLLYGEEEDVRRLAAKALDDEVQDWAYAVMTICQPLEDRLRANCPVDAGDLGTEIRDRLLQQGEAEQDIRQLAARALAGDIQAWARAVLALSEILEVHERTGVDLVQIH